MSDRIERMQAALSTHLDTNDIDIRDDGHKHIGHAAWKQGLGHFSVTIRSPRFVGATPVQRHKMVYEALGSMLETDVHALQIKALAPDE